MRGRFLSSAQAGDGVAQGAGLRVGDAVAGYDVVGGDTAAVVAGVGFGLRLDERALQRDPGIDARGRGPGDDVRTAERGGAFDFGAEGGQSEAGVRADLEVIGHDGAERAFGLDEEDHLALGGADLQAEAGRADLVKSGVGPAVGAADHEEGRAALAADEEAGLEDARGDEDGARGGEQLAGVAELLVTMEILQGADRVVDSGLLVRAGEGGGVGAEGGAGEDGGDGGPFAERFRHAVSSFDRPWRPG